MRISLQHCKDEDVITVNDVIIIGNSAVSKVFRGTVRQHHTIRRTRRHRRIGGGGFCICIIHLMDDATMMTSQFIL